MRQQQPAVDKSAPASPSSGGVGITLRQDVIAANVRKLLELDDRSQAWLARKLGLDSAALTRRLRGGPKGTRFTLEDVERIAGILNVRLERLLNDGQD